MNEYVGVADIILTILVLAGAYVARTFNQKIDKNADISDRDNQRQENKMDELRKDLDATKLLMRDTDRHIYGEAKEEAIKSAEELGYRKGKEAQ